MSFLLAPPQWKSSMKILRITQVDAARTQLSWAIKLLVEYGEPIPAITLAGAAEEVLGKSVKNRPSAHAQIKSSLGDRGIADRDKIGAFMNELRNFLKHDKDCSLRVAEAELQSEAIQMISRAATNYARAGKSALPEHYAFLDWAKAQRPDLFIRSE